MIDRVKFVNELLRYASLVEDPDKILDEMLAYLGRELNADRAYIFEEFCGEYFSNTYEWCREGVSAEKNNLQNLPYNIGEVWYKEYDKSNNIRILDIEEYKKVSLPMYEILKPQGIHTLVTGPLELNDKYIGFFGVDNPPVENIEDISEIISMLCYIMSIMIRHRDDIVRMREMSMEDQLTGALNRHALSGLEGVIKGKNKINLMVCDINGLKKMNDTKGHEAGDRLIRDAADAMIKVFGKGNVFRVGGDEFVVLVQELSEEGFQKKIEKMKLLHEMSDVTVAIGYVHYNQSKFSIQQMMKEADAMMYEDKRRFYMDSGKDRRNR